MVIVPIRNRIEETIKAKKITIWRLAKMWGKDYSYVHRLVKAQPLPGGTDIKTMVEVADLVGCKVDDLIELIPNGHPPESEAHDG